MQNFFQELHIDSYALCPEPKNKVDLKKKSRLRGDSSTQLLFR